MRSTFGLAVSALMLSTTVAWAQVPVPVIAPVATQTTGAIVQGTTQNPQAPMEEKSAASTDEKAQPPKDEKK